MRKAAIAVLLLAAILAFGGFFWVTDHQRTSLVDVEAEVTDQQIAKKVSCIKRTDNGALWWCAGMVGTKGSCWVVHVPVLGGMKIRDGRARCRQVAALAAILKPRR
jgi:hypothetical protein